MNWTTHIDVPWQPSRLRAWTGSLVLLPFCLYFALSWGDYTILDGADLVIHEAGHFLLRPFGELIHMLGGTLMQLFVPALMVLYFARVKYRFGVQTSLLWLGQSFINVSVYAADARTQELPLLGNGTHDWHYLLSRYDLLSQDIVFAFSFFSLALVCFLTLLVLPRFMAAE